MVVTVNRELARAGGISAVCLLIYVLSWSDSISLVDAGLFQLICQDNGIAHPPGYPLATLLCHPFMSLPLPGTLPGNLFSAAFSSATLVVFFLLARSLALEPLWALLATFSLGLALAFWSQSIIIEVYTLNTFLYALAFLGTIRYLEGGRDCWLIIAVLAFAFGLSNHWPLILLSAFAFLPLLIARFKRVRAVFMRPGFLASLILCLLAGLSPYLLVLMKPAGVTSMIGDINDLQDFWRLVSRQTYGDSVFEQANNNFGYLWWLPFTSINQLGHLAFFLVPLGVIHSFKHLRLRFAASLVLLWLSNVTLLPLITNYPFDQSMQAHYSTWILLAIFPCAIWLALGLRMLLSQFPSVRVFGVAAVILAIAAQNFSRLGAQDTIWVDRYYRMLFDSLKEDAVLFVAGDAQTGPSAYLRFVERVRTDVEVRHQHNILFANRLVQPDLPESIQQEAVKRFVDHTPRPVYSISGLGYTSTDFGIYHELSDMAGFGFMPALDAFMTQLIPALKANAIREPFIRLWLHSIVYDYARVVVGHSFLVDELDDYAKARLHMISGTLQGKIWTLHHLLRRDHDIDSEKLISLIESGEIHVLGDPVDTGAGAFLRLAGEAYQERLNDPGKAADYFSRARTFDVRDETCRYLEVSPRQDLLKPLDC